MIRGGCMGKMYWQEQRIAAWPSGAVDGGLLIVAPHQRVHIDIVRISTQNGYSNLKCTITDYCKLTTGTPTHQYRTAACTTYVLEGLECMTNGT